MPYVGVFKDKDDKYCTRFLDEERRQQNAEHEAKTMAKKIGMEYVTVDHTDEESFM